MKNEKIILIGGLLLVILIDNSLISRFNIIGFLLLVVLAPAIIMGVLSRAMWNGTDVNIYSLFVSIVYTVGIRLFVFIKMTPEVVESIAKNTEHLCRSVQGLAVNDVSINLNISSFATLLLFEFGLVRICNRRRI